MAEQLHGSFNRNKHFLNQMSPDNHIFLFRSIIDLKNEDSNQKFLLKAATEKNLPVNCDVIGRAVFENNQTSAEPIDMQVEAQDSFYEKDLSDSSIDNDADTISLPAVNSPEARLREYKSNLASEVVDSAGEKEPERYQTMLKWVVHLLIILQRLSTCFFQNPHLRAKVFVTLKSIQKDSGWRICL